MVSTGTSPPHASKVEKQFDEVLSRLGPEESHVEDSASEDTPPVVKKLPLPKSRRSDSGTSSGLKQTRLSSGGGLPKTPASVTSPRMGPAKITPRDTKSSTLRKSMGSGDGSSLRTALAAMRDGSSTPNAAGSELSRLRNDLRAKQKEVEELESKLSSLHTSAASKERALAKAQAGNETLKVRVGKLEGELIGKTKSSRVTESANLQLQSQAEEFKKEIDRLKRRLEAVPKGTGLSEAIGSLEGEIRKVKAENEKLEYDNKGAYNQIRAKDKELDTMALEVEAAHEILIQNGELENYVMQLRSQLDESAAEKATLLNVQRQMRNDMDKLTEEADEARTDAANARHELNICQTQLEASKDHARETGHELELRRKELVRVGKVAARAAHKDASSLKEDGMIDFQLHKEEVMQMRAEHEKTKEKLRLSEKKLADLQIKTQLSQASKTKANKAKSALTPRNFQSENIVSN